MQASLAILRLDLVLWKPSPRTVCDHNDTLLITHFLSLLQESVRAEWSARESGRPVDTRG